MPRNLKNNPLTFFIRTSQSVSKERKSILHTVRGNATFRCPSRLYIRTTTIQYIYLRYVFWNTKKYWFRWVCRRQYSLHISFKYRRSVRKSSRGIRATLSAVLCKSLGSKCRKVSPSYTSSKITNNIAISHTNTSVSSEQKVKLLGINLECRLNFDYHVNTLLKKANKKYHAITRICN